MFVLVLGRVRLGVVIQATLQNGAMYVASNLSPSHHCVRQCVSDVDSGTPR